MSKYIQIYPRYTKIYQYVLPRGRAGRAGLTAAWYFVCLFCYILNIYLDRYLVHVWYNFGGGGNISVQELSGRPRLEKQIGTNALAAGGHGCVAWLGTSVHPKQFAMTVTEHGLSLTGTSRTLRQMHEVYHK